MHCLSFQESYFSGGTLVQLKAFTGQPSIAFWMVDSARASGLPIIYISDTHREGDHEFEIWGEHAVSGSEGSEIIPELEPRKDDYQLEKEKYSAFYNTELNSLLGELGVDKIVLTGVDTHLHPAHCG